MILFFILGTMLISSISVILYVNYLTASNEKELRESAGRRKMIGPVTRSGEMEKQVLLEETIIQ